MKITSNDTIQLEELYKDLRRNAQEATLDKNPVENAMGLDVVIDIAINLDIDVTKTLIGLYATYLADKRLTLFLKKPSGELEPIDTEILEDEKKLEKLEIDKESTFYIEYKKR